MANWLEAMWYLLLYVIGISVFGGLLFWVDYKFFGGQEKLFKGIGIFIGAVLLLAFCSPGLPLRVQ